MRREAMLWEAVGDGRVHCFLCAHECRIAESKFGVCGVRQNSGGQLYTLVYGEAVAANVDPIEKKPLYHFLPGTLSYSIATAGCNFRCGFCQNWQISQVSGKEGTVVSGKKMSPDQIVRSAREHDCASIAYTYTEPTIFFEYAYDTARLAREAGLYNVFVTNGYITRQAVDTIAPYLDAANVDLKSSDDGFYRRNCAARLKPVLDSIAYMKERGIWVEVTTLLIPGENDSSEDITEVARFLSGLDPNIPWHLSAFHPTYRFTDYPPTPVATLKKAYDIGRQQGLHYVYMGNVPEIVDTRCPGCNELLVKRAHFGVKQEMIQDGKCPSCGAAIPGLWAR
ncbi:MAG: AmmeMemoRadiSam system radical SAM enzyme [Chloroflexota bacterium]